MMRAVKENATTTLTVRAVTDAAGLAECQQLEQVVWGAEHAVPLPLMIASNHVSTNEFWGFQYLLSPLYEMLGTIVYQWRGWI